MLLPPRVIVRFDLDPGDNELMNRFASRESLLSLAPWFNDFLANTETTPVGLFDDFPNLLARCPKLKGNIALVSQTLSAERLRNALVQLFTTQRIRALAEERFDVSTRVEDVYVEPRPVHPPQKEPYREQQQYLDAAPTGIHLDATSGATGPVKLIEIEQGWNLAHEELRDRKFNLLFGINHRFHGHGTSVLGILAANGANDAGGTGMVPASVQIDLSSEFSSTTEGKVLYSTARAIGAALDRGGLSEGDIILLEAQFRSTDGLLLPSEVDPAVRAVIDCAIAEYKVLVIAAAGNGGVLLDSYRCGPPLCKEPHQPFTPGNASQSILVGAGSSNELHAPLFFSNRGSAVACYAWGEDVTTCGDGSTSQEEDDYRSDFSGTSAAAAIVAGVAAVLQSIATARGQRLTAAELRARLVDPQNGTVTVHTMGIGVMPDLDTLIATLGNATPRPSQPEPTDTPSPEPTDTPSPAPPAPPPGP